MILPKRK